MLRVNVCKSKVMFCSRYGNGGLLEEANCFKYLESQVAADGGYERDMVLRMNEGA